MEATDRATAPAPRPIDQFEVDDVRLDAVARSVLGRLVSAFDDGDVPPLVSSAVAIAIDAHAGQRRRSGELYVSHPLEVATIVAECGFDPPTIAAAVCHDVVEDTTCTLDELAEWLGTEVAALVDGVSKLAKVSFASSADAAAASMTKFLVAVTEDIRVLVVKLADRLHNLRTIEHLDAERQRRSAAEALEVFSPLAHRLGLDELRCEMEDLAFAVLHPEAYDATRRALERDAAPRAALARSVVDRIAAVCAEQGINASIEWRLKHLWSVHRKALRTDTDVTALPDLVGVRVVVDDIPECYKALGAVHASCTPVPGRFKDLIAVPRPSGYRSLHTTVLVDASPVEVQIRTREMHLQARFGVAAHYRYKERIRRRNRPGTPKVRPDDDLVDALAGAGSPGAFLEALRKDLAPPSQVVVLTPAGKPVDLPTGANVIDFAYKIHTDIGHRCIGARVNGRIVPIRTALRTGDVVEVRTGNSPAPSRDWIDIVTTARAREKIRKFFADRPVDQTVRVRSELAAELAGRGVPDLDADPTVVERLCRLNGATDLDALIADMVEHRRAPAELAGLPRRRFRTLSRRRATDDAVESFDAAVARLVGGLPCTIAQCCAPTSIASASAYITAARTITVHRSDCPNYLAALRTLPAAELGRLWDLDPNTERSVVEVAATDHPGLLRDCAAVFDDHQITVIATTVSTNEGRSTVRFEVGATVPGSLASAASAVASLSAVTAASVVLASRR